MPRSLQAELQQRAAFPNREEEAYLSLLRTADRLLRDVADLLKEHGLTPTQYNALRILRGAGAVGLLTGEVGTRLVTQDPDVPRLLDRLEKRGWITRAREAGDRRCVRAVLTPPGRALVDALDAPIAALHQAQLGHLGAGTLDALLATLAEIRAATDAEPLAESCPVAADATPETATERGSARAS
jgi:DNA-binding MarR family transcriptional regulator